MALQEQAVDSARGGTGETPDERGRRLALAKTQAGANPMQRAVEDAGLDWAPLFSHAIRSAPLTGLMTTEVLAGQPPSVMQRQADTLVNSPGFMGLMSNSGAFGDLALAADVLTLGSEVARTGSFQPLMDAAEAQLMPWRTKGLNPAESDLPYGERLLRSLNLFGAAKQLGGDHSGFRHRPARDHGEALTEGVDFGGPGGFRQPGASEGEHELPKDVTKEPLLPKLQSDRWHLDIHPRTTRQQLREIIRNYPREVLAVFGSDDLPAAAPIVGDRDIVDVRSFRSALKGMGIVHNHPDNRVVSEDDFTEVAHADAPYVEAILPNGQDMIVERPTNGWPNPKAMEEAWKVGYRRSAKLGSYANLKTDVNEINRALRKAFGESAPQIRFME